MSRVSLNLFKAHVGASEFESELVLQDCLDSAEAVVVRGTNRTADELAEMGGGNFPSDLSHAILMVAAEYYSVREEGTPLNLKRIPDAALTIVKSYKRLVPDGLGIQPYYIPAAQEEPES